MTYRYPQTRPAIVLMSILSSRIARRVAGGGLPAPTGRIRSLRGLDGRRATARCLDGSRVFIHVLTEVRSGVIRVRREESKCSMWSMPLAEDQDAVGEFALDSESGS